MATSRSSAASGGSDPRQTQAWLARTAPIAVAVVVPVVVAAGYFALWACAAAPASLRPIAPLPVGNTGEFGVGAITGLHYQNPDSGNVDAPKQWGGGGQLWLSRRGQRVDFGGIIKAGSFGIGPSLTLRWWPVIAERFRLGAGAELGITGGMVEIPFGFAPTERLWLYAAPRVHNLPYAISVPAGMSLRVGSRASLVLEGGGIVYSIASSDSLDHLGMRTYGAAGAAFSF